MGGLDGVTQPGGERCDGRLRRALTAPRLGSWLRSGRTDAARKGVDVRPAANDDEGMVIEL